MLLIMCIVTTLNQGLRNGGVIGDVLHKPSSTVSVTAIFNWHIAQCLLLQVEDNSVNLIDNIECKYKD